MTDPALPNDAPAVAAVENLMRNSSDGFSLIAVFDPTAIPVAALGLLAAGLVLRLLRRSANRLAEHRPAQRLLIRQAATLAEFFTYAVSSLIALSLVVEFSPEALFAMSGTLALAAGFLLKDVGESVVAGISILITRPFHVGDRISFGGVYGEVREIGLRSVRLVTLDDNLVTIPSTSILRQPVASANAGALACMVVLRFYLDASAPYERAKTIVDEAILSCRFLDLSRPRQVLTSLKLHDHIGSVIVLTGKAYVFDTRREKEFESDVTDRVIRAFRSENIQLVGAAPSAHPAPSAA